MPALRTLLEGLGYEDVTTYIQSGNVIFSTKDAAAKVSSAVHDAIAGQFGVDVAVVVRSRRQLEKVLDGNPFAKKAKDPNALHVVFLAAKPKPDRVKALTGADWGDEEVAVKDTEAYLHLPNGYGRAKLNNMVVEKQLGVAGTARNWRTTAKLLELSSPGRAPGRKS
jgi:uncharacterized protein (DUF1697 family)